MRGEAADWWNHGPIRALRLDLVDEAPGSIEIGALRLTAQRDDLLVPAAGQRLTQWGEPYALGFELRQGRMALDIQALDCRLLSRDVPLDPTAIRYLVIRYRAWGFQAKETGGQIFYANGRHGI
jgi:hypothetical protein